MYNKVNNTQYNEFKNSVAVAIRRFQSQPFTNIHFHFITILRCAMAGQMHHCSLGLLWEAMVHQCNKDRQHPYNVTATCVRVTIAAVEEHEALNAPSVSVLLPKLSGMPMPPFDCHLWPVRMHHIFPHYLTNGTIFGEKLFNTKYAFWFSLQLSSQTFVILRRIRRDMVFMSSTRYFCQISNLNFLYRLTKNNFWTRHPRCV
jgi:hypothetical protein